MEDLQWNSRVTGARGHARGMVLKVGWGGGRLIHNHDKKRNHKQQIFNILIRKGGVSSFYLKVLFKKNCCLCSRPKKWKGPRQLLQNSIFTCIYVNLWNMSVVRKMSGGGVGWSPLDATFLRGRGCTRTYINSVCTSNWEVYFRANYWKFFIFILIIRQNTKQL